MKISNHTCEKYLHSVRPNPEPPHSRDVREGPHRFFILSTSLILPHTHPVNRNLPQRPYPPTVPLKPYLSCQTPCPSRINPLNTSDSMPQPNANWGQVPAKVQTVWHLAGRRVERDAPAGYVRPLIEPYVQFSRIRLSVWKLVFIAPDPRILSESFHFGHDGIVQLGRAVYGSPHHLRIAPFDRPFGQYISRPHVLCLPFARRGPSLHGHCPFPRYYGLVRPLASLRNW